MQLAAYAGALHSLAQTQPDLFRAIADTAGVPRTGYLVQIPREYSEGMDPWKVETVEEWELDYLGGVFNSLLPVYQWQHEVREAEKAEKEKARSDG